MFTDELLFIAPEGDFLANAAGGFARQVLVVSVSEPGFVQGREFLAKVLAAAKLDFGKDTLFVEIPENEPLALVRAAQRKHAGVVLVFGILPAQAGLNVQANYYQPFQFGGTTFLFSEKLSLLEPDRDRKGKLWNALKIIFL